MYESQFTRVETMLKDVVKRLERIEHKMDDFIYEDTDDEPVTNEDTTPFHNEDEIYTKGERVPYNKLSGQQVTIFRDFLAYMRMHENDYSQKETDYASFADKNFRDIRLSDNMKRILETAYFRTYNKPWPFKFIKGYLYKWDGQKAWAWSDGSKD